MMLPLSPSETAASGSGAQPAFAERARWWTARPAIAVGVLLLTILAFYYKLWWPGLVLIKRDAAMTFLPIKHYMIDRLRAGELPEWFPYDSLGRPFLGVAITGVFHPFTLLYFLLPPADALRFSTLLCCLLAAAGAFGLSRRLQVSVAGSFLAGLAFACSGYVVSLTENIQYLYGACLIPLFLLALDKALTSRPAWIVAPAFLWAGMLLSLLLMAESAWRKHPDEPKGPEHVSTTAG